MNFRSMKQAFRRRLWADILSAFIYTSKTSTRSLKQRCWLVLGERKPVMDQFYGDRSGQLEDPFGHLWWVATHKEDVSMEELKKRMQAMEGPA